MEPLWALYRSGAEASVHAMQEPVMSLLCDVSKRREAGSAAQPRGVRSSDRPTPALGGLALMVLTGLFLLLLQSAQLPAEEVRGPGVPGDKLGTGLVRKGPTSPQTAPAMKPSLKDGNLDLDGGPASEVRAPRPKAEPREDKAGRGMATGTGFFITGTGYLVTNHHVVEGGTRIRVLTHAKKPLPARVVAQDKKADLAILKVAVEDHACLPVVPSRGVRLGSSVATVGFPNIGVQGYSPKLAKGEIAALSGIQDDPGRFQISVPLQPGNSGGALVDARGNVVGVVAAILNQKVALETSGALATNVAYAVKSSLLLNLMESVPGLAQQLVRQRTEAKEFLDVVEDVERAAALIIVE